MSYSIIAAHEVVQHVSSFISDGNGIPNPKPKAPPGATKASSDVIAYAKWGSLIIIVIGMIAGPGAMVGGKLFSHHKSASIGVSILLVSTISLIIWGMVFKFYSGWV